jgi:hypothetical protein
MALDYSIALGVKPVQLESPINQMAKVYELQNAVQSNKLNQLNLGEAERKIEERNRLRSTLGGFGSDMSIDKQVNELARAGFLDEAKALAESASKVGKERRESEKALTDTEAANIKTMREYLPMVKDQASYDAWRNETAKRLPSYAGLFPVQYSPELNQTLALSADKALENHFVNQENVMVNGVPTSRVLQVPKYGTGAAATVAGSQGATYNKPAASTTINVSTNTAKKYGEVFATKAAEADNAMRDAAVSAPKQAENANNILSALNSGQLYLGAGADVKLGLARFLNMAGKDDNEKIANTQILMQGQSQATLNAIKSAGLGTSQGFTDKDLVFLKGIAGGTIALDGTTIRRLAELQHKAATESVNKWTTRRSSIPKDALEGTGIDQEAYEVPPMVQPPKGKPAAGAPSAPAKTRSGATTSNW